MQLFTCSQWNSNVWKVGFCIHVDLFEYKHLFNVEKASANLHSIFAMNKSLVRFFHCFILGWRTLNLITGVVVLRWCAVFKQFHCGALYFQTLSVCRKLWYMFKFCTIPEPIFQTQIGTLLMRLFFFNKLRLCPGPVFVALFYKWRLRPPAESC